jgi:hypothetical protein
MKPIRSSILTTSRGLRTGTLPISVQLDRLRSNKLRFHLWLTVFKKHRNDLTQVFVQLIECFALRVSTRKSGYVSNVQASLDTLFYDCSEVMHFVIKLPRLWLIPTASI